LDKIKKDKLIKAELRKLNKFFKNIPEDRQKIIKGLKEQAAFMYATLMELQEIMNTEGPVELFEQGAQKMLREHPAAKTYNSMIKNYEELGFRSQKELEESIERVKAAKKNPKNDLELRAENKARFDAMNKNGGIDLKGLEEGARLAELDRVVASKLYWEREAEKQKAEQEELNKLMGAVADNIKTEKEAEAQREFKKQKAKADEELQKEIYKKHNVKTDKQIEEEAAYKSMLDSLKL